jgi:hypothetical protein
MAEVKVKITAQSEVQTGLQTSLAQVKQFAGEAQRTMAQAFEPRILPNPTREAPNIGPIDIGDYGLGPLRELQEQLRQAREGAQSAFDPAPVERFDGGVAGVVGRFAILIGIAATVGKVIASAFDQLSSAVASATEVQRQFAASLEAAGSAGTLGGAISEFKQLQNLADQTGKILDETIGKGVGEALANAVSGRPMQLFSRIADAFSGGSVSGTLQENEKEQRNQARRAFLASLQQQRIDAEALAAAGGDPSALESAKRSQELRDRRKDFEVSLEGSGLTEQQSKQAREDLEATIAAEEAALSANRRLESEKEITREKERQQKLESGTREGNVIGKQLGPGSFEGLEELEREREGARRDAEQKAKEAERTQKEADRKKQRADEFNLNSKLLESRALGDEAAQESILRQQDLEKGMEATGSFDQAARFAAAAAALREQQGQATADAFGASSLQRVGGASTEFFRTGPRDPAEQQKKTNALLSNILKEFSDKETLVLKNS